MRARSVLTACVTVGLSAAAVVALAPAASANTAYPRIATSSGKCLGIYNGSTANGAAAAQWNCDSGALDQYWSLESAANAPGYVEIRNLKSNKCLGTSGGSASNGAAVIQWDCNGNPDQHWRADVYLVTTSSGSFYANMFVNQASVNAGSPKCLGINGGGQANGASALIWTCGTITYNPDQFWQ